MSDWDTSDPTNERDIAIIGMAGRFPGAKNLDAFWDNLEHGVESISFFTPEEVEAAGVDPALINDPHYVRAGSALADIDLFDAGFFGFFPREAEIMDPQHRIFLECAWEALESAACDPSTYPGLVGVYAGVGLNSYFLYHVLPSLETVGSSDVYTYMLGNDKDFVPTRVSYKLNLKGPSVNIQTACSTSLVATHLACQSLLNYESDVCLAGGVSIRSPQKRGYLYQEGGISSPDGHCRPFDSHAQGTVAGNGVAIVVLKRLQDALENGDPIRAIIKGSAINNDGSLKIGYTAPSIEGQAEVIALAQALAQVSPESISYVETHGTGTSLGDPIEIAALTNAFRVGTQANGFCAIGSVKANVGHLDAAAGATGLIKTVLSLEHQTLPPSINYQAPNPQIDFEHSPFYVNDKLTAWQTHSSTPRRAGVSSFGLGGTNAHVVVQEPPTRPPSSRSRSWQLLLLSAKTTPALEQATDNLGAYLSENPNVMLPDVAYTLQLGRQALSERRMILASDLQDGMAAIESRDTKRVFTSSAKEGQHPIVFMFSGQGAQYPNMARGLYETEPFFRDIVDACALILQPLLELDIRTLLFPSDARIDKAAEQLKQTAFTQPALFTIEYALAQLWMHWGVKPETLIGHSLGEYTAACLAGVWSLPDALRLVTARGRMMQSMSPGAMLSVPLSEEQLAPYLTEGLSLAVINAPSLCAVGGPADQVDELERQLEAAGTTCRKLQTSHAFHSWMMAPILEPFAEEVARSNPQPPQIPFVSNVTGTWITEAEATDPQYWAKQLGETIRFADGVQTILEDPARILLEVGPGRTLSSLTRMHPACERSRVVLGSVRHPRADDSDVAHILTSLGRLWAEGVDIDWDAYYANEKRYRLPLPTYPFQRKRYWIKLQDRKQAASNARPYKRSNVQEWFYLPSWKRVDLIAETEPLASYAADQSWLIFADRSGLGQELHQTLNAEGLATAIVTPNARFTRDNDLTYGVDPNEPADYAALVQDLLASGHTLTHVAYFWGVDPDQEPSNGDLLDEDEGQMRGFYSLLYLVQALAAQGISDPVRLCVVTTQAQSIIGEEVLSPAKATLLGLSRVIPQEYRNITCQNIDIATRDLDLQGKHVFIDRLLAEVRSEPIEPVLAYRGQHRWVQIFEPAQMPPTPRKPVRLKERGVYMITGGLGRIGLVLAEYLARTVQARLVLVGHSEFPPNDQWEQWLATHSDTDRISLRIRALQSIKELGADLLIIQADVARREQMETAVAQAYEQFGALAGIIHAAGLIGEATIVPIQEATAATCQAQMWPKARGAAVLASILRDKPLDFCILQSSLSTVLGGLGFAAYASANAFLDALAYRESQLGPTHWISINWDGWQFDGNQLLAPRSRQLDLTLTPEEGQEVFEQLLSTHLPPQVVVSTGALQARLDEWVMSTDLAPKDTEEDESQSLELRPDLSTDFVAPSSEMEQEIAAVWRQVLGIDQIGIHDDFFELGGHSLVATQVVSRLRDMYRVELPLRNIFERPTISGLVEYIQGASGESKEDQPTDIQPFPREGNIPLSFGQQRLWFLDQLEPGSPLYNNFAAVRLDGALDTALLAQCVNEIVSRHEALRTTFDQVDGQPVQKIAPNMTLDIPVTDLRSLSEEQQMARVRQLALNAGQKPCDLKNGPLIRIELLKLGPQSHVMLVTAHHIVSDGWSVRVFIQEVAALYPAFAEGRPSPLPDPGIQYADYVMWQRQWLQDSVLESQLAYWKEQLADLPPALELATDYPRPAVQTSHGASQWFEIPADLFQALKQQCRENDATLFMTLLAALQVLLSRYTGQEEICIGTPIANRNRPETEGLIGFLLNTLALRTDLSGDPTVRELLTRVRQVALDAYAHQDLPFEMLVEALQPARDMSRAPVFQVMFDLQVAPLGTLQLPGITLTPLRIENGTAKFDLALSMEEDDGGLHGYLNYNTDLFAGDTIARMLDHFQVLLQSFVSHPDQAISTLTILTEAEKRRLLVTWNDTLTVDDDDRLVQQAIENAVEQSPQATAIVCEGRLLSYSELNERANQLAHHLRALGVEADTRVGACLQRSELAIIALLAILKAGGAYVPIDPAYPQERQDLIAKDAGVPVLLTQQALLDQLPAGSFRVITLDSDWERIAEESTDNLVPIAGPEHLACVIYTSGSTGIPKGVAISNGALATHCRDIGRHYGLSADSHVLQFASLSFDQSIEQILPTLSIGAMVVMRGPDVWSPAEFNRMIQKHGITVANLPTAYWHQLVQDWALHPTSAPHEQLQLVIPGGDRVRPEIVHLWIQSPMRTVHLLNAYGPTETTVTATTYEIPPNFAESGLREVPIGRPLPNRSAYILDKHGQLAPIGVPGELYLGGAGLAREYLNDADLTAQRFLPDPFSNEPGARMYRTGDIARYLNDGNIDFMGRVDSQTKVRGFRIEIGEIETVLGEHPAVSQAIVQVWDDATGGKYLSAYVVPADEYDVSTGELFPYVRTRLPEYMAPSVYMIMDSLPLTPSGKLDRQALPVPERNRSEVYGEHVAPRTPLEERLVAIWAELLTADRVGIHDNFFELGGHSLLATQLSSRLRDALGLEVSVRTLFEAPTVATLAEAILAQQALLTDESDLAELIEDLEQLSDEEARKILDDQL